MQGEESEPRTEPGRAHLLTKTRVENLEKIRAEIEEIDERMKSLKDRRNILVAERDRLMRLVHYVPSNAGTGEVLFVDPRPLRPLIEEFCSLHGIGAVRMLAERAQVTTKSIWRIRTSDSRKISLNIADRILIAIGKEEEISGMEIFRKTNGEMMSLDGLDAISERDERFLQMPY